MGSNTWLVMGDMGGLGTFAHQNDVRFTYTLDDHRVPVLTSPTIGSIYYAACKRTETSGDGEVFAT